MRIRFVRSSTPPLYQLIAQRATLLHRLGMTSPQIALVLGVRRPHCEELLSSLNYTAVGFLVLVLGGPVFAQESGPGVMGAPPPEVYVIEMAARSQNHAQN